VTTSVTDVSDIAAYKDIRRNALGDLKPALMLAVVTQMIDPRILIEIEAWAAKPIDGGN
jgi:enamine deaminase RidA (YjgF/YER057c/UK114 family)